MALELPTPPRRGPRGPLALLAAAAVGAALAGGALLLAERLRGPSAVPAPAAARGEGGAVPSAGATSTGPVRPGVAPAITWRCPMHPDLPRGGPGTCPICGMRLVRDEEPAVQR